MNKPLLGPCDTYQLEPFDYPWAWDWSRECENNTWTPEEVASSDDVLAWKTGQATEAEQHLFLSVMAQLTTFDIQRGDDAAETFLGIFQPAEIAHFLKRLVWEEALHTRSYRYIIETMSLDLEIYQRWERVPAMKARIDYANDMSDRIWLHAGPERAGTIEWSQRAKEEIFLGLVFWFLIFEGVWFVLGLSGPIQSLARRGLFKGAAEQFQYILRDEFQHVRFGTKLIGEYVLQHPEVETESTWSKINQMFDDCIELEREYIEYCLPEPILGYNADDHVEMARYYSDRRLRSIGMPARYHAKNVMPWMDEMLLTRKEKNFFESRVTEYQTGGSLKWD